MIFNNPYAFLFLVLVPLYFALKKINFFKKPSFPIVLYDWNAGEGEFFGGRFRLYNVLLFFADSLGVVGFILLIFALSDPVMHTQEKIYTSKGAEILFVLDTSPSMAAKDISVVSGLRPEMITRFEAAKRGIKTLVSDSAGLTYGLVAMAKEAAILVPPTDDFDFFGKQLDSVAIGEFGDGTAIGTGLGSAVFHLSSSSALKKAIILITDGENNAGSIHPQTAAELARQNGITLYVIGIGTRGTVPIEYVDVATGKIVSGFYESEFDSSELEKIALFSGGQYFGLENFPSVTEKLALISRKESVVQSFYLRTTEILYFKKFLFFSALAFFVSWICKRLILKEIF